MQSILLKCASVSLCSLLVFAVGCGGGSATSSTGNQAPPSPVVSTLSPSTATAGSPGTVLTVTGSNFVAGSEITWNGTERATLYVSSTSLQANLLSSDLSSAATISVGVTNPTDAGGASSNTLPFLISQQTSPNPVPVLSSISPSGAQTGASATSITLTGSNFVQDSTVTWNGQTITSSYNSATSLTATIPASDLQTAGTAQVAVGNPAPGGGTSNSVAFTISAVGTVGQSEVALPAKDLAWDPVNQVIYLSVPSAVGSNGNSVQTLNPVTGALGAAVFAGSEPDLLAVSANSKYLYASLDGSSSLQRFDLPALTPDINISFGPASFYGSYVAMDVQASPAADGTVAFVLGTPGTSPEEEGGVLIYDDSTARPNSLCGFIEFNCPGIATSGGNLFDSIQWNTAANEMYALDNEDTGFNFYSIPVNAQGFGTVTSYGALAGGFGDELHYDATTQLLYTNDGVVIDPSTGTKIGEFSASGLAVPDGKNGVIYFLGTSSFGSQNYSIESFDINHFTPIASLPVNNVVGTPTHFIRWGTNGLAFTTTSTNSTGTPNGEVYLISGSFVSANFRPAAKPTQNVVRTWKLPRSRSLHLLEPASRLQ